MVLCVLKSLLLLRTFPTTLLEDLLQGLFFHAFCTHSLLNFLFMCNGNYWIWGSQVRPYFLVTLLHFLGLMLSFFSVLGRWALGSGRSCFFKFKCVDMETKIRNSEIKLINLNLFSVKQTVFYTILYLTLVFVFFTNQTNYIFSGNKDQCFTGLWLHFRSDSITKFLV